MLSFEGKRIDFGANKSKLRRFEIRAFCDKMRPFCTISASIFWKIQPDIYIYIYIYKLDDVDISRNLIGLLSMANQWTMSTLRDVENFRCKTIASVNARFAVATE